MSNCKNVSILGKLIKLQLKILGCLTVNHIRILTNALPNLLINGVYLPYTYHTVPTILNIQVGTKLL